MVTVIACAIIIGELHTCLPANMHTHMRTQESTCLKHVCCLLLQPGGKMRGEFQCLAVCSTFLCLKHLSRFELVTCQRLTKKEKKKKKRKTT